MADAAIQQSGSGVMVPAWHPGRRVRVTALRVDGTVVEWWPLWGRVLVRLDRAVPDYRVQAPPQSGRCNWWPDVTGWPPTQPIRRIMRAWAIWAAPGELE